MSRLTRLGQFAFRRRRLVLAAWVAALFSAFALSAALGGAFSADYATPGSDSKAAADALVERFPASSPDTVDVVWRTADASRVDGFLREAETLPGLAAASEPEVSPDGQVAVARLPVTMPPADVPAATGERLLELGSAAHVELGGQVIQVAQQGPISSEMVGLGVAGLVLLIALGTVVAAGLPLLLALFGLGIASALITLLAAVLDTPDWSSTMAAMLGIGVGIDYALLILTRYRAALADGASGEDAIGEAVGTAGRSVLDGRHDRRDLALRPVRDGAHVPVRRRAGLDHRRARRDGGRDHAAAGAARVRGRADRAAAAPGPRRASGRFAGRWSRAVQRRPWTAAAAGVAVLLVLASPATGLRLGFPDAGNDRSETTTRQAFDLVTRHFGEGANGPLVVVAPARSAESVAAVLDADPGIATVAPPALNPAGDTALVLANPTTSPQAPATEDTLARLRDGRLGADVVIGGRTAQAVDQASATSARLPIFIGIVAGALAAPAAGRVPVGHRCFEGGGAEPVLGRRGLRRRRAARAGRLGGPAGRDRHRHARPAVHPGDHVRDAVRPLDGLRGLPALARPRGVAARSRHAGRRDRGTDPHRGRDLGRRGDHGRRLRRPGALSPRSS